MHMSNGIIRRRYRSVLALIAVPPIVLLASSPGAVAAGSVQAAATAASVADTVTVNAGQSIATVPSTAIGLNASTYDGDVTDSAVPGLISKAGVSVMRFPGGTESDEYNWKTNADVLSGRAQAASFDQFMSMLGRDSGDTDDHGELRHRQHDRQERVAAGDRGRRWPPTG